MRWALTGTPGTGKTTVAADLELDFPVVHINDLLEDSTYQTGYDSKRDSVIADLDALTEWLENQPPDLLIESHLAHLLPVDRTIVLRCHPNRLAERLEGRGTPGSKLEENVEAERLDLILAEAIDRHGRDGVFEIDTTDREPSAVQSAIRAIVAGRSHPEPGQVSFPMDP